MNTDQKLKLTLDDLLQIENESSVLDVKCTQTGIPLWPLVRVPFFRAAMSDILYAVPLTGAAPPVSKLKAIGTFSRFCAHNARHRPKMRADILIMATGIGNMFQNGYWFNRLGDPFALVQQERTLLIEDAFSWQWPYPRLNKRVLFHAPTQAGAAFLGRAFCRKEHTAQSRGLISLVAQRGRQLLGWDLGQERSEKLTYFLARKAAAIPWLYRTYQDLLGRVKPKLLIKEEACYGPSAVLIQAARSLGITTAEYQHGAISVGHDAYNFSPVLRDHPDYRKILPDYFLGYGRWWNNQINAPVRKLAIGNPHRSEQVLRYTDITDRDSGTILVLGDGMETELYLNLARQLASGLGGKYSIVFRPHPLERANFLKKFSTASTGSVRVDGNADIYQSFQSAYAVVSELSTGLFEAVGLVKRIFIWNTPKARFCFPSHPFEAFESPEELLAQITNANTSGMTPEMAAEIWEPNWRQNYQQFLAEVGVLDPRELTK